MFVSICGDICSECPRYLATLTNSDEELNRVANQWFRLGFRDHIVGPEEIKCNGCNKQKICSYNLNSCKNLEGIINCGECYFFPCEKFDLVFEKSHQGDESFKARLDASEYAHFKRIFFMKKEILTEIHNQKFKT
jgi:hypothetical protein